MSDEEMRVSDAERETAIAQLKGACAEGRLTLEEFSERLDDALQARTRGELTVVTRDLPATPSVYSSPVRRAARWLVAVMGSNRASGRWRIEGETHAIAVMGECIVDLRHAEIGGSEVVINAYSVMGEVRVVVPEGVPVDLEGLVVMGSRDCRLTEHVLPGAPLVRVRAFGLMGNVSVTNGRREPGRPVIADHRAARLERRLERRAARRRLE